ncbi:MAG: hypothetical protein JRG96_00960 [Deltaproteobacteria bacterium]|nr:hypothetical protein [Deltaproteobacteria bacterium]MBW2418136.1 hypothetical protein [Deltaproteobacteria bacterium]
MMAKRSALPRLLLVVTLSGLLGGCLSDGFDEVAFQQINVEDSAPLGGEALAQRKVEMRRALSDMLAFHETMASMIERRDSRSISIFDDFMATYMGTHLDPLLRPEWPSGHPELISLDANLRFAQAEILVQMRYPRRVQRVIDDIDRRYQGRGTMLVNYPIGEQNTLEVALERLKDSKWRG